MAEQCGFSGADLFAIRCLMGDRRDLGRAVPQRVACELADIPINTWRSVEQGRRRCVSRARLLPLLLSEEISEDEIGAVT